MIYLQCAISFSSGLTEFFFNIYSIHTAPYNIDNNKENIDWYEIRLEIYIHL